MNAPKNPTYPPTYPLDAHYYTKAEIFEAEQSKIFATTWQFAGHASLIRKSWRLFYLSHWR